MSGFIEPLQVDEKALSELDDEAFLSLRRAQALPIAYVLNLSMPQAHLLARLARMNPAQAEASENLDDFFESDEELNFDFDWGKSHDRPQPPSPHGE